MNTIKVAPSVLSADFCKLADELESINKSDYIHFDVMDGSYVPNISFGPAILKAVKRATNIPVDCHLMIVRPELLVDEFIDAGADLVSFHLEATPHAHRLIQHIKSKGAKAGIVINPQTPVSMLEYLVSEVDLVLIMSVNPGFGGQSFIEESVEKIKQLKALCDLKGVHPIIEVDGGVSAKNAALVAEAGADMLVAGSAVFSQEDRNAAIEEIRAQGELGVSRR